MRKELDDFANQADQARVMAELHEIVGFHISLANTAVKSHFHKHFSYLNLTQKQIAFLWIVGRCPGIAQADLVKHLQAKRATVSAMVETLQGRGLVSRRSPSGEDRRRVPLELTREGKDTLKKAKIAIAEHEQSLMSRFCDKEREQIRRLMTKLYGVQYSRLR